MSGPSFQRRRQDWRLGAVVYQVFVDRFSPPASLDAKRGLYTVPQTLRAWSDLPKRSGYSAEIKGYPHVYEFWGGDLAGVASRLDYIQGLGSDVLYLNPIFKAPSNHKYDTEDYFEVDPQYGSRKDLESLQKALHKRGMKLVLDGVFNHSGSRYKPFVEAASDPKSKHREWFMFGEEYKYGYRGWSGVATLPALNLENKAVREALWLKKDSVVQHYLRQGLDGWRLDVAFELGPDHLGELTQSAKKARKDAWVVGEILGYPAEWKGALDGTFNAFSMLQSLKMIAGEVPGGRVGRMLDDLTADAGIEFLLNCWLITDNHDTPRLATVVPSLADRTLLRTLQFTLPGSPCLYYGSELGMEGGEDPENRAPMRWDLVQEKNKELAAVRRLLGIRKALPALRIGDFKALQTDKLLAFARTTDQTEEAVVVLVNPTSKPVREVFATRIGRILSWGEFKDALSSQRVRSIAGSFDVEVPARTAMILTPVVDPVNGYSVYDRIIAAERKSGR